jgi:hypothetical protein
VSVNIWVRKHKIKICFRRYEILEIDKRKCSMSPKVNICYDPTLYPLILVPYQ